MRLIESIVKRIFSEFVRNTDYLTKETNLYTDLNLNADHVKSIRQRIEQIFSVRIPEELFMNKTTYGGILDFVQAIYVQAAKLSKASLN